MMTKVLILFHSIHGHIFEMAKAAYNGAKEVKGCRVELKKVEETFSKEILEKMGAIEIQKKFSSVPSYFQIL